MNESTLIPRPETEELVEWIIEDFKEKSSGATLTLLDIGTGSGCIPISIKKKLSSTRVISCDISAKAIEVARKNAAALGTEVEFLVSDILDETRWPDLSEVDIIVSNPPYIPAGDKLSMSPNVLNHEPHEALFVPDNNALLFYEAIAKLAKFKLRPGGFLYFEIHESLAAAVTDLLNNQRFGDVIVRKDLQEKDRMVRAQLKL